MVSGSNPITAADRFLDRAREALETADFDRHNQAQYHAQAQAFALVSIAESLRELVQEAKEANTEPYPDALLY